MGLVYATATLEPGKQELFEAWSPTRAWAGGATSVEKVGEYRFDDPAGEVGVETIVWRTPDGTLLQVPFSYRASPLAGAEEHLVGTGVYYPIPNHQLSSLTPYAEGLELPVTQQVAAEVISLPIHPSLSQADLERIVAGAAR